jgi:hypothetical protein
MGQLSKVI